MGRSLCRVFLVAGLLGSWVAGCTKPMTTKQVKPPPPDPLLLSKKPVQGKPYGAEGDPMAQFDPTPPAVPAPPPPPARQAGTSHWQRDPVTGVRTGVQPEGNAALQPAGR